MYSAPDTQDLLCYFRILFFWTLALLLENVSHTAANGTCDKQNCAVCEQQSYVTSRQF